MGPGLASRIVSTGTTAAPILGVRGGWGRFVRPVINARGAAELHGGSAMASRGRKGTLGDRSE